MSHSEKEELFKTIVTQHQNQIQRICSGFSVNAEDIKDLYQEVIINVWKGLDKYRGDASYSTWIHRITINSCLLWKKKTKTNSHEINESVIKNQIENPEDRLTDNPQLVILKQAINQLKSSDKAIILLVLEELSYKEISDITGLSISNIGVKINRIKSKLKSFFKNYTQ